jgi:beta-1,4-mannosyl-glycoprotein beta-1,4-N-acetylglucosaminyltransferase
MIYDCFTYNGEREILDIRLNILGKKVDRFIVVESKTTFSGNKKPLYFSLQEKYFRKWWHKIDYYIIDENYTDQEIDLARRSPNTVGAKHWVNEFLQKESIKKALVSLQDDDIVYIGDVDEIWEGHYEGTEKLLLRVYAYYLNNRSNELFWGTLVAKWGDIKNECLNHVRTDITLRGNEVSGWHFTSMGGLAEVRRKLNDSYTEESYNTQEVQRLLQERVSKGQDYLGRNFVFNLDESEWPRYLKENRRKFKHLIKPLWQNKPNLGNQ